MFYPLNTNPRHVKKHVTVAAKYFLDCMLSIVVFLTGSLNLVQMYHDL